MPSLTLHQESETRIRRNGAVVYRAASAGIMPDPQELVSVWAENHRVVPEGGAVAGEWRNSTAYYLVEPMDALSPNDPCEQVIIIKPAQSGGSAVAENWLGFVMHRTPGPAMYVGPTVIAAKDWFEEKLQPTIEATKVLSPAKGGVVMPRKSRAGDGSKANRTKFKGGFLLLAGANSAASLRQHSIRFMVRDDRSAWTDNADGEGDPKELSSKRLKTYRRFGLAKVLDVSSPKFKGEDIDADYQKSDMRRYYMACRGCGALTDYEWEDVQKNATPPYRSHLVCPACGTEHYEGDKPRMLAPESGACWVPTAPDADGVVPPKTIPASEIEVWRHRHTGRLAKGYAITGIMNAFDTLDSLAQLEAEAGDDPEKRQPFENGDLGRAWEPKGEGPQWETIAARKEGDWRRGTLPAGVLYVTLTADVQADGIYWAFVGWGPGKQAWHMDQGFLPGVTDEPLGGAWPKLDMVADHGVSFGGVRIGADMIAVDSGYNAEAVYEWVRRRHNALAVKGDDGWSKNPISRSQNAEVQTHGLSAGKARRYGIKVWMVGTWSIKATLITFLGKVPKEGGAGFPTGYHHFPGDTEEQYFRHLTSEYIVNGEQRREFKQRGPNHWLDCLVYAYALTHFAQLWSWSEEQWDVRARELSEMTRPAQADMFVNSAKAVAMPAPVDGDAADGAPAAPLRAKPQSDGLDALSKLNQ
ncbi:MAG: phage terminase large subunit family protein [Devosia sp.]|uniref:terminase gpA endonuclease subunit n=2 Tax=Devosia TaxID=46913 RepID=UPI001AC58A4E|nr:MULTISPECIES: terminase gpA endonuclease subunit [unclassified Devosia]MBN9304102.1 phage terminase large subunit family protein [Devosia sp.]